MRVQTMRAESWLKILMCAKEYLHVSRRVKVQQLVTGDSDGVGDAPVVNKNSFGALQENKNPCRRLHGDKKHLDLRIGTEKSVKQQAWTRAE